MTSFETFPASCSNSTHGELARAAGGHSNAVLSAAAARPVASRLFPALLAMALASVFALAIALGPGVGRAFAASPLEDAGPNISTTVGGGTLELSLKLKNPSGSTTMYAFTKGNFPWNGSTYEDTVESIYIAPGITALEPWAFNGFNSVDTLYLPESLKRDEYATTTIPDSAFGGSGWQNVSVYFGGTQAEWDGMLKHGVGDDNFLIDLEYHNSGLTCLNGGPCTISFAHGSCGFFKEDGERILNTLDLRADAGIIGRKLEPTVQYDLDKDGIMDLRCLKTESGNYTFEPLGGSPLVIKAALSNITLDQVERNQLYGARKPYFSELNVNFGVIEKKDISNAEVRVGPAVYDGGNPVTPSVTVIWGDKPANKKELARYSDYGLSFANNTEKGVGIVTVTGLNEYEGSKAVRFVIDDAGWKRLAGDDRYQTADAIVERAFPGGCDYAVVATGTSFPDALAASSLAGAYDAPVLLVKGTDAKLDAGTTKQLTRLGVKKVFIMGGESAVSKGIEDDIVGMVGGASNVERLAGATRIQTSTKAATAVANAVVAKEMISSDVPDVAIVATANSFPDALSIGPWAYAHNYPILLASGDKLSDEARGYLNEPWVKRVVIVGGEAAVSKSVENDAKSVKSSLTVERIAGADRYETSKKIADVEIADGMGAERAAVATGANFPDALAGSALCGTYRSPLLLVQNGDVSALKSLEGKSVVQGFVLGGESAILDSLMQAVAKVTGLEIMKASDADASEASGLSVAESSEL